jgi:hypothetical protein
MDTALNLDDIKDLKDISHCLMGTLDPQTQKQGNEGINYSIH